MTGIVDYLKAYYRVCRLEYLPGEIPAVFTVLFLGSVSVSRFQALPVIEALVAFILLYLSGFIINALADKEIDQKYDTFKTSIPKSVDLLGEKTLKAMIIGHVIIAIALALHITFQMNSFVPITLVLVGVFFGLGYSIKPFHFKVRGVWHAIALGSSAFFLPFLFLMYVIAEGITLPLFVFILGFSFIHYGMEFGNQAIDYVEDKASNVRTPPVRWGMIPSLNVALGFVVVGIIGEAVGLYYIVLSKGSFTFIHPFLTKNIVFVIFLCIVIAGYYIPTKGLWQMLATLKRSKVIEDGMPTLKKICNYAKWQTSGIMGVAIVSGILFFSVIYGPATQLYNGSEHGKNTSNGLLIIASPPQVEFFQDDEGSWANVTVSILNDDIHRERGSFMVMIQSWTANISMRAQPLLLDRTLLPYEYWNVSTIIYAHDVDDTTVKIEILEDLTGHGDFERIGEPWIVPSQKKIYIFDANVEIFEDIFQNKKANVTVTVFNGGDTKAIGDLKVDIKYYYYLFLEEEGDVKNNITLHENEMWIPNVIIDVNELHIGDAIFVINLYYEDNHIDDLTIIK